MGDDLSGDSPKALGELSLALGRAGIGILALTPELATLEDLFFRLTEGAERDNAAQAAAANGSATPATVGVA